MIDFITYEQSLRYAHFADKILKNYFQNIGFAERRGKISADRNQRATESWLVFSDGTLLFY